ncbi:YgjP-like metallopeptidase domain-containing protein [Nostoc sp. FACHB-145]|nr:DUF45 domain-containing protein [Nostoc sp. FACHB-145]
MLHRNHGDRFLEALSCIMPDWRTRKAQLESWEGRVLLGNR